MQVLKEEIETDHYADVFTSNFLHRKGYHLALNNGEAESFWSDIQNKVRQKQNDLYKYICHKLMGGLSYNRRTLN